MWIRVTRTQGRAGDEAALAQGIANFEQQVIPAFRKMKGYLGAVLLVNRASGEGSSVTYWQDEAALQASEEAADRLRAQTAQQSELTIVDVDRFEMILAERMAPPMAGSFVRTNDVKGDPAKIDEAVSFLRDKIVPVLRQQPGFRAALSAVNRKTGRGITSTVWETEKDREASNSAIMDMREQAVKISAASDVRVDKWESVVVELSQEAIAAV